MASTGVGGAEVEHAATELRRDEADSAAKVSFGVTPVSEIATQSSHVILCG